MQLLAVQVDLKPVDLWILCCWYCCVHPLSQGQGSPALAHISLSLLGDSLMGLARAVFFGFAKSSDELRYRQYLDSRKSPWLLQAASGPILAATVLAKDEPTVANIWVAIALPAALLLLHLSSLRIRSGFAMVATFTVFWSAARLFAVFNNAWSHKAERFLISGKFKTAF